MRRNKLLLAFLVLGPAARAQQSPATVKSALDLPAYLAVLDQWSDAAGKLPGHPRMAARVRKELPRTWEVNFQGQQFEVETAWLDQALKAIEKSPASASAESHYIQRRLEAMSEEAESLGEVSPGLDPTAPRRKLDEILKRREFRGLRGPSHLENTLLQAWFWLMDHLERLMSQLGRHPRGVRVVLWTMLIGPAVLLLIWLLRFILDRSRTQTLDLDAPRPAAATWRTLAREAVLAAGRGDYRDAVRLAYWAGIYRLEELGAWKAERTRTHREYLRLLPSDHPNRDSVSALTSRFERTWYAGVAASSDDFQFTRSELEKLGCVFPSTAATARS